VFQRVRVDKYAGQRDPRTLELLGTDPQVE
jgi:hypothetical protein